MPILLSTLLLKPVLRAMAFLNGFLLAIAALLLLGSTFGSGPSFAPFPLFLTFQHAH